MTGPGGTPAPALLTGAPCADYLAAAESAGALFRFDGHDVLAGEFTDPLTGESQCVVEYAAPPLLVGPGSKDRLVTFASTIVPAARSVLLRRPGGPALPAPWARSLTYLCLDTAPPPPAATGGLTVRPASAADEPAIRGWIGEAIAAGLRVRESDAPAQAVAVQTDRVWRREDRVSFVAVADGEPVGHGTLLLDERDDLTGEPFVELWDTLVARPALRRPATELLVAAAAGRARRADLPLVGHVVHPAAHEDGTGDRVVVSLTAKGWRTTHDYWIHPLGRGGAR